jgi:hypothetical protein
LILDTPKIAFPFWTKPIGACKNQLKLPQNKTAFYFCSILFLDQAYWRMEKSMKINLKRLKNQGKILQI